MLKKLFFLISLVALTSCISNLNNLTRKENTLRLEGFYSSYLALEYLEYSRSLATNYSWYNSEYFAKKGLDVSRGFKVEPESPMKWNVDPIEYEDAIMAQKRLERVSIYEMQKRLPIQMAHLTFLYDCWISKESKPAFRLGEMARCKVRFYKLLNEVEQYLEDLHKDKGPKTIIKEPEFERFEIRFDFDKYYLNDKANKKMIEVLKHLDDLNGDYSVLLVGNADRVDNNLYNETLALKRVKTVQEYLQRNGVKNDMISVRSFGENLPDIITKDAIQHQLNRTVSIYVLKGIGDFSTYPVPLIENYVYQNEIKQARKFRGLEE